MTHLTVQISYWRARTGYKGLQSTVRGFRRELRAIQQHVFTVLTHLPVSSAEPDEIIDLTLDSDDIGATISITPEMKPVKLDKPPTQLHRLNLSQEQKYILKNVTDGNSVFFTGSAGTGKSVLLREIIQDIRHKQEKILHVTASTGIASVNIGGTTLHSWAGIGEASKTTFASNVS